MKKMINIKYISDEGLDYITSNIETITNKIMDNEDNKWLNNLLAESMFVTKNLTIEDFELIENQDTKDKKIDFENSIKLFKSLDILPRYVLVDNRFWLWLMLDKFYKETKSFMSVKSSSTIKDHWNIKNNRRGLFFGVLSRMFFRVERTLIDNDDSLTKWIIEKPERFRNLSWRTYSDNKIIIHGALKGCKAAIEKLGYENNDNYTEIAKFIGYLGSATLLDAYSEEELSLLVYNEMLRLS